MTDEIINKAQIGSARTIARNLLENSGVVEPPISLWKVLKYIQEKIDVSIYPYDFGKKISGVLTQVDESMFAIGYNSSQSWHKRRFTIAHEIGHLLMGHTNSMADNKCCEKEADEFAAELLIPLKILKDDFKKIGELKPLAEKYNVSEEALCIHLINCKLLKY